MSYEATGRIMEMGPIMTVGTAKTYEKREVVLELGSEYPQLVQFELFGKNAHRANECTVGDEVTLHFDLKGRAWTKDGVTRYFNKLNVWKVERVDARAAIPANPTHGTEYDGPDDDLPF